MSNHLLLAEHCPNQGKPVQKLFVNVKNGKLYMRVESVQKEVIREKDLDSQRAMDFIRQNEGPEGRYCFWRRPDAKAWVENPEPVFSNATQRERRQR